MSDNKTSVIARAREIIDNYQGEPIRIMEVCGTHTHEIFRLGIRQILPDKVRLISGPGCPVCVTPVDFIDEAVYLAMEKNVTICTFGDLVRVPGSFGTAGAAKAADKGSGQGQKARESGQGQKARESGQGQVPKRQRSAASQPPVRQAPGSRWSTHLRMRLPTQRNIPRSRLFFCPLVLRRRHLPPAWRSKRQ